MNCFSIFLKELIIIVKSMIIFNNAVIQYCVEVKDAISLLPYINFVMSRILY